MSEYRGEADIVNHAPSCPVCTTRERVDRHGRKWLCRTCWTVFRGGQDEWERTRDMREHHAKREAQRKEA